MTATIFYNGACPVCRHEMQRYTDADPDGRTAWCDAAEQAPDALLAQGISHRAAKRRLHAVDDHGRLHAGIDAVALLWERTPGQAWLAALARHRLVHPLAAFVYDRLIAAALYRWAERRLARRGTPTAGCAKQR